MSVIGGSDRDWHLTACVGSSAFEDQTIVRNVGNNINFLLFIMGRCHWLPCLVVKNNSSDTTQILRDLIVVCWTSEADTFFFKFSNPFRR